MSARQHDAPVCAGRNGAQDHGKHTPGPWYYGISYEPERGPVPFDYVAPGFYENTGIIAANGETVVGCGEYHIFNTDADARLIAAAPELLEALKQAEQQIDYGQIDAAHRIIIAAIAKAEGRSDV